MDLQQHIKSAILLQRGMLALGKSASWRALTPTIDTGIAMSIQTSFIDTNGLVHIHNNAPSTVGFYVVPDYIKLIVTAAGATTTSSEYAIAIDDVNGRFSSGGSVLSSVPTNTKFLTQSNTTVIRAGALTLVAAGGNRKITNHGIVKIAAAPVFAVGDEILFSFLDPASAPYLSGAFLTTPGKVGIQCRPVAVGPQTCAILHVWNPANAVTPPSFEVEVAWHEVEDLNA